VKPALACAMPKIVLIRLNLNSPNNLQEHGASASDIEQREPRLRAGIILPQRSTAINVVSTLTSLFTFIIKEC
jgi:hypothetical protein